MSKGFIIFDINAGSETEKGSCTSEPFCGTGENLLELGFGALEDARLSRALSLPLFECDGGGENSEGIDGLESFGEDLESTAESSEGFELTSERVRGLLSILRDMVGFGEGADAVDVLEQTIRYVKNLQTELRCNFH